MMKYFTLLFFSVLHLYALVSISPVEIGDNPGLTGVVNGSFDTKRGNTESQNYAAGVKLSYDNNASYLMWGEFSFSYGEASGERNANQTYTHLRYIHTIRENLDWEAFVQSQGNEFTKVDERFLTGAGLRIHLNKERYGNLYFGLGGFYEYISYTTEVDPRENNIRCNLYLAYKKEFTKDSKFSYVAYYQPKISNVGDYIFSNAVELTILIYEKLYINFTVGYNNDSMPANGVKSEDFSQKTAFIYKF